MIFVFTFIFAICDKVIEIQELHAIIAQTFFKAFISQQLKPYSDILQRVRLFLVNLDLLFSN